MEPDPSLLGNPWFWIGCMLFWFLAECSHEIVLVLLTKICHYLDEREIRKLYKKHSDK